MATLSKTSYYAAFKPTQIAGCQLWLDGADASTVTGTTTVTAWNDKSDKGYRLVPGTGTTSYANKGITISSSYLYANGTVDLTTLTFFIVAKNIGTTYNQPFFAAIPNTTSTFDSTDGFGWYMDNGNQTRFFGRYINNTGQWITTTGLNTLNTGLYTVTGTSAGVYTQWNNGTLGNTVTSSSRTSTARGFTVGGEWYADGSAWNTYTNSGTIYEVIVYNTVLSTADRQKVEGYLAWKWGIQAQLPPYTPKSITGCSLWYDAADTTTLVLSSGNATSWTDKASGIVLTSGSPAYTTSNSYPLVRFSGSVTYTSSTNLPFSGVCTSNANFTSFIVAATSSSTGVNGLPLTVYLAGNASRFAPFVNADGSIFFDGATQGSPRLGGITQTLNTPQILTFSRTGLTTMYANVNGTQKSTNNFTTPANFSSGSYIIYMSQSGALWKGDMYEVLYYNVDLTTAQVQQVEGYLAWKWGLQASLPGAHPYYSAAPAGHPYISAAPLGPFLRPAISAALVPAGAKSISKNSYYVTFTPTQIAGCQLWLDGADPAGTGVVPSNNSTVATWYDKSGNGYNASATVSGATFTAASQNGIGYITFPTGKYFTTSNFVPSANNTPSIFIVCQQTGYVGSGNSEIFVATVGSPYVFYTLDIFGAFATKTVAINMYNNTNQSGNVSIATPAVISLVGTGSPNYTATLWGNGTSNVTITGSSSNPFSVSMGFTIGAQSGFIGNIYEIILYNTALTTADRQKVEGYLAWKWGLQASLPTFSGPASITGCALWLDGADPAGTGVAPANGSTVTTWVDKSGSGNSMQATGTITYNATTKSLHENNTYFSTSTITNQVYTLFIVFNHSGNSSLFSRNLIYGNDGCHPYYDGTFYLARSDNSWYSQASVFSLGVTYMAVFQFDSSNNIYMWKNGDITPTVTTTKSGTITVNQLCLGYKVSDPVGTLGDYYEVFMYSTAINTSQRQTVEGYLAWKWGLQANLPNAHPYASSAPAGHPYATAAPLGPFLRPAISAALVPAGAKSMAKASYYGSFKPTQIAGCALWLDAADPSATGVLPTGTVATWVDKSGNGNNGTSIGNAGSVTWSSNGLNGYPTITFDGATGSYSGTIATNTGSTLSMFAVAYINQGTTVNNYPRIISLAASGSQDYASLTGTFLGRNVLNTNPQSIMTYRNGSILSYQLITYGTPFVASSVYTGSANTTYANGTTAGAGASSGNFGYNTYNIGRIAGGAGFNTDSTLLGAVSEVIVFNTALTTFQRQQVEGYLAAKWGLQANLPTFTPTSITGCGLWLDATDSSTITLSGTSVTSFKDKSANAVTFTTQGTASYLTVTPGINGVQSLYFNNTAAENVSILGTVPQPGTVNMFIVWQQTPQQAGSYRNILGWQMSTLTNPGAINYGYTGTNAVGFWDTFNGNGSGSYSVTNSSNYIGFFSLPSPTISLNGATPTSTPISYSSNWTTLYIGGVPAYGQSVSMYLGEVIMYNNALTTTQRQQVEGYLATKWGLQSSLPSGHPYYTLPYSSIHPYTSSAPIGASLRPAISAALAPLPVSITIPPYYLVDSTSWTSGWQPYLKALVASNSSATAVFSSNSVSGTEPNTNGSWGMNLGPNGLIYTFPTNSAYIGIINPITSVYTPSAISSGYGTGGYKYMGGGALHPNGNIYSTPCGNPANTVNVGVLRPSGSSGTFTTIANTSNAATDAFDGGAVLAPNGMMYLVPRGSTYIGRIDTNGTFTSNSVSGSVPSGDKYMGASLGPNGLIYCIPGGTVLNVGVIDPIANSYSSNYVTMLNTPVSYAYLGSVLAPNGKIYCIPFNSPTVGIIDPVANTYSDGPAISSAANAAGSGYGNNAYFGGCLGPDGNIYCAPLTANNILVINPTTNTVSYLSTGFTSPQYRGILLAPNGKLYMKSSGNGPTGTNMIATISFTGLSQVPSLNWCLSAYANRSF